MKKGSDRRSKEAARRLAALGGSAPDFPDIPLRRSAKPYIKIHSSRVILAGGTSEELVPGTKEAAGMHGVAIMVPPGENGEQLIEMMWWIAMVYAGLPSLLYRPSKVQKMVEAIMIRKSRKSPASKAAKGLHL